MRKRLFENKSDKLVILKYNSKLLIKSYELKKDLYNTNMYVPLSKKIGKIDVTKNLLKFDEGKKIKISQKGNTPKFTQK
tara:strand:- start:94 stop:330 length:237 start_codon:yes stop_codon:yes gene_type:complete